MQNIKREVSGAYDAGLIVAGYRYRDLGPERGYEQLLLTGAPRVTQTRIRFAGGADGSCEDFDFNLREPVHEWQAQREKAFSFCKTRRYRYDFTVMVVLALLKDGLGDAIDVHTDGSLNTDPDYLKKIAPDRAQPGAERIASAMTGAGWVSDRTVVLGNVSLQTGQGTAITSPSDLLTSIAGILGEWSNYGDEWNIAREYMRERYGIEISVDEGDVTTRRVKASEA